MLGKSLNILAKFLVVIFLLLLAYVVFVLLINLRDKPPSAAAVEFEQAWNNRPPVDDENNGYLFLLGFDVAENQDPRAIGLARVEWSKSAIASLTEDSLDFPQPSYNLYEHLPVKFAELVNLCRDITHRCMIAIAENRALINEWQNNHNWVNNRYRQLITHKGWLELSALDIRLPLPKYAEVMQAQRIMFMSAFTANPPTLNLEFGKLLDRDLQFWRRVLQNTDTLIAKMIAVSAIKNNFLWANHFLLGGGRLLSSASHYQVFSKDEMSMYRCFIGEWQFAYTSYQRQFDKQLTKTSEKLLMGLAHKKQDTINQMAERLKKILKNLEVPAAQLEAALAAHEQALQQESAAQTKLNFLAKPYNVVGQILVNVATPAYGNYVVRTQNLEAFRRGLLLSAEKMDAQPIVDSVLASPYPNKPFVVDEQQRSITVTGLGKNNAHIQQVYYY